MNEDWELISEVGSVKSLGSEDFGQGPVLVWTFKDAVLANLMSGKGEGINTVSTNRKAAAPLKILSPTTATTTKVSTRSSESVSFKPVQQRRDKKSRSKLLERR